MSAARSPRKRIDVLLDVFAAVRQARPDARLTRVGGPFTAEQRVRARDLGVAATRSSCCRSWTARRSPPSTGARPLALLPSEREGFGLPIVEALARGTPMVASDIPVLREIGSGRGGPIARSATSPPGPRPFCALMRERDTDAAAWQARRHGGLARAADSQLGHLHRGRWSRVPIGGLAVCRRRRRRDVREPPACMKRVLHVGKFYPPHPGGMERVVETLCHASAGLVENHVLALNDGRADRSRRSSTACT